LIPIFFYLPGYNREPKQLPSKLLRNQYVLRKEITALTKVHAAYVKETRTLKKVCLKRGNCGIFFSGKPLDEGALQTLNRVSDSNPSFSWIIIDSSKVKLRKPSEKELGLRKFVPGTHRLLMIGNVTSDVDSKATAIASSLSGAFTEEAVFKFVVDFVKDPSRSDPSRSVHQIDPEGLSIMKRKAATQYRTSTAPASSPTPNQQAKILPTAEQAEMRKAAAARRAQHEAARRAAMDAEADDFIEYEEDEEDDGPIDNGNIEDDDENAEVDDDVVELD
jgi:hypothetical protein